MLKEVFVLGCLLSLALAQPVSETFSFSVSTQVSLYVDTVSYCNSIRQYQMCDLWIFCRWRQHADELLGQTPAQALAQAQKR